MATSLTSGFTAAYTELVFKTSPSLWVRNMQLATWSLCVILVGMSITGLHGIQQRGFFFGWNWLVVTTVTLQALGGVIVATVAKYADNVAKGFSSAISIVLTCIVSRFLFDWKPSAAFAVGSTSVICSICLYAKRPQDAQNSMPHAYAAVSTEVTATELGKAEEPPARVREATNES
ncbi:unnamed protein product [Effrenium voratum]|nr:unnamed protein product [Effrenium voratum]